VDQREGPTEVVESHVVLREHQVRMRLVLLNRHPLIPRSLEEEEVGDEGALRVVEEQGGELERPRPAVQPMRFEHMLVVHDRLVVPLPWVEEELRR